MKIIILNFILSTAVNGRIIRRPTNRDTMIYNVARGFVANGHSVTICASDEYHPLEEESNDFEVVYFRSRFKKICKPTLLPWPVGLGKFLKSKARETDLILSIETFSIPTLIASRISPQKMLIWQEVGQYQRLGFQIPARIWCNVIARFAMGRIPTVAMSENARAFSRGFISEVADSIVPHGADEAVFFPDEERGDYFIVVAMLIKRKRIDTIIERFADFAKCHNGIPIRLKIIGEGPEEKHLRSVAHKCGIAEYIDFEGFMNHKEMSAISRKAIGFLVNTASDLNMVSVTESIANGTPVLMNTVPHTASLINKYTVGIAKDDWNAPELNEMVERYDEFHQNCISHRNEFTNRGVSKRLVEIFLERKRF